MVGAVERLLGAGLTRAGLGHLDVIRAGQLGGSSGSAAVFSSCHHYRYLLTRVWAPERPPVVFVMLNPSTADAFVDDRTIGKCTKFAKREDAGGIVVVNAFGWRATDPRELDGHPDPVGPDNDAVILAALGAFAWPARAIVGWGADKNIRLSGRDREVVRIIEAAGVQPLCLGVTKFGFPCHPLFLHSDTPLQPYALPLALTPSRRGNH